jgi:hypothetical protein
VGPISTAHVHSTNAPVDTNTEKRVPTADWECKEKWSAYKTKARIQQQEAVRVSRDIKMRDNC